MERLGTDFGISLVCLILFYLYRAQHYSGDGALIARMTEGGKWLVQNELLSQALLQGFYQLALPWKRTAFEIMNVVSCLGGAAAIWILFRFARLYSQSTVLSLLLFFSSGFSIYSCGHTEYYPLLLPAMLLYGYAGILYLRGNLSVAPVTWIFLWASGLHFGMLIALPSLLLLPWLHGKKRDWGSIATWLVLLIPLFLIRNYPQILNHKAAGLSPAWNFLPWFPYEGMYRYYAVFQWGHWVDWIYAWTMRSWVFWPALFVLIVRQGWKRFLDRESIFLFVYGIAFTFWTMLWHPDLGIEADWDLFALEATPCLLLLISYLPSIREDSLGKTMLAIACVASFLINFAHIQRKYDAPRRGYGGISMETSTPIEAVFTLDGLNRPLQVPRIREGVYRGKLIDQSHRRVEEMYIVVQPDRSTDIVIKE